MLLVSCLCAVAAFVCVSDGTLRRDVHWQNDDHDDSDNMTRLEAKLSHRLHNTERRLTWRFSRLLKRQNRSALQLEGNVRELRQQLREVTAAAGQRAGLVRRLERRLAKQQRELTRTKTAFRRLEATVGNLSRTIDALLTANGGPPPTQTIPQPVLPAGEWGDGICRHLVVFTAEWSRAWESLTMVKLWSRKVFSSNTGRGTACTAYH